MSGAGNEVIDVEAHPASVVVAAATRNARCIAIIVVPPLMTPEDDSPSLQCLPFLVTLLCQALGFRRVRCYNCPDRTYCAEGDGDETAELLVVQEQVYSARDHAAEYQEGHYLAPD